MSKRKQTQDPPKSNEAPAYMGQFASLMTILLAFFIIMLTLGRNRTSQYKAGVGNIRNLTGFTGGTGVLDFWRAIRKPPAPSIIDDEEEEAMLIGHKHGARDSYSLSIKDLQNIDFEDPRKTLRIRSGIHFKTNRMMIDKASYFELDHITSLLYSLDQHTIVVEVRVDTGAPERDRLLATQRATWLMRHMVQQGRIPYGRIRSTGLANRLEDENANNYTEVVFLIRRITSS